MDVTWQIFMSRRRRFRICMPKWGRGSLRPSYGQPELTLLSKKNRQHWGVIKNCIFHNFRLCEEIGKFYFENCGRYSFLLHLIFLLTDRFCRPQPTSDDQNTVKTAPQPIFANKAFGPLCIAITWPFMTHPSISLRFQVTARRVNKFCFSLISLSVCKKSFGLV